MLILSCGMRWIKYRSVIGCNPQLYELAAYSVHYIACDDTRVFSEKWSPLPLGRKILFTYVSDITGELWSWISSSSL